MKVYAEATTEALFSSLSQQIKEAIEKESDNYVLNVGEAQYVEHLLDRFRIEVFPEIYKDQATVTSYETEVSARFFPPEFMFVDRNKVVKKDVVVFHVPYSGDITLLRFRPNTYSLSIGAEFKYDASSKTVLFEFINFYNDPERTKREFEDSFRLLTTCYGELKAEIQAFNDQLPSFIQNAFQNRKRQLLNKSNFLGSLGVPIKKNENAASTFSIPKPALRKKIVIQRPAAPQQGFQPEPTLNDGYYRDILKIINDVGKNFERMPSLYSGMGEETLRDHILMTLDPNFELGSASGETFNKSGKTDILLRYDSSVVFVAECKFWSGEKKLAETVDQLLGYLTWRDSKTSLVIFVQNKGMTSVIESAKNAIKAHPRFIKEGPPSDSSWFNYIVSLPSDTNKEIKMALQMFHIPQVTD